MRLLATLLVLAATPALAGQPVHRGATPVSTHALNAAPAVGVCGPLAPEAVGHVPVRTGALRPLTRLPSANMERAVWRRIGGCPVAVIVRYGVDEKRPDDLSR